MTILRFRKKKEDEEFVRSEQERNAEFERERKAHDDYYRWDLDLDLELDMEANRPYYFYWGKKRVFHFEDPPGMNRISRTKTEMEKWDEFDCYGSE